jgi:hypothetical protein
LLLTREHPQRLLQRRIQVAQIKFAFGIQSILTVFLTNNMVSILYFSKPKEI